MKKIFSYLTIIFMVLGAYVQAARPTSCYSFNCPYPGPQPYGYCPNSQNQDSTVLTFFVNPFDFIELHDHSVEFSNCAYIDPCSCGFLSSGRNCTCVTSSFGAATNSASCSTPKKIVGQINPPMPCCTDLYVELGTPTLSCAIPPCGGGGICNNQQPGFCGVNQCIQRLSDGTPQDLITCITCPFSDCDIDLTYLFCADICAPPGSFQTTFFISLVDQAATDCCGVNDCVCAN